MRRVLLIALLTLAIPASARAAGAPIIEYQLHGQVGNTSWYVSDVTVAWTIDWNGGVPVSGCQIAMLIEVDTTPTGITRSCTAISSLGSSTVTTSAFRIDQTKPSVTSAGPQRAADQAGWFNRPVEVGWSGSDASSGIAACSAQSYAGPDSANAAVSGTCRDGAGNVSAPAGVPLKYDATPPAVSGLAPERPADALGFFVRPVSLTFTGSDATSGIESCDTVSYAGPDSTSAGVSGACRDVAGNASSATVPIAYDATAPALTKVAAVAGDSLATLSWDASGDTRLVRITRKPGPARPIYEGPARRFSDAQLKNGVRYTYTLTAIDEAGHGTSRAVSALPSARLLAPGAGATLRVPPRLRWKRVRKASYYNVQLFRGKQKIYSAWPRRTRLQLTSAWRYARRWQRLAPGTYRWYVWPGYGERYQRRYGRVLGSRTFKIE